MFSHGWHEAFPYKEDKEAVVQSFKKLIEDGVYREELYSDL